MCISPNEGAWNTLITSHVKSRRSQLALIVYQKMQEVFLSPNGFAFVALVNACAELRDADQGQEIHAE
eukprot:c11033_g1_i1 orf=2-202(-)